MWKALLPLQRRLSGAGARWVSSSPTMDWMQQFTNYERKGVPSHAGMDTDEGFDLGRMRRLLARLGDPQKKWAAVHVAGTKGKGSTTALIASILTQADYIVGTYTSPHVAAFNERIVVDTIPITTAALDELVQRHRGEIEAAQGEEGGALTHFEVVTALAYKHFEEQEVDMAVVEVGMGGARDATNVLGDTLRVAVFCAVAEDHKGAIGDTLEEIAATKAGIMKEGRPAVIARQPYPEAERVLRERAALLGCPVVYAPAEVDFEQWGPEFVPGEGFRDSSEMHLEGPTVSALLEPFQPSTWDVTMRLLGPHQGDNAAAAVAACAVLKRQGFHRITLQSVIDGLAEAYLPGRFQICNFQLSASGAAGAGAAEAAEPPGPVGGGEEPPPAALRGVTTGGAVMQGGGASTTGPVCLVPSRQEPWVILDGAHTPESGKAVAATLREMFPNNPVALVVAMAGDKQHTEFMAELRAIQPHVVIFTQVSIAGAMARAAAPGALAAAWQAAGMQHAPPRPGGPRTRVLIQASLAAAVDKARTELSGAPGTGVVCVTGSMHIVGAALRQLDLVQC